MIGRSPMLFPKIRSGADSHLEQNRRIISGIFAILYALGMFFVDRLKSRSRLEACEMSAFDPKRTWRLLGRMGTLSQERSSGGTVSAMEPRGNQAQRA